MSNYVKNVAIVGAGGQVGKYIANELVAAKKFNVTAITRADSTSEIPSGITKVNVDYSDQSSLVSALKGQDVLVITMAVTAPPDTQNKLLHAVAEAKVPWVFPNEWGLDYVDATFTKEALTGEPIIKARKLIEELGVSNWVACVCGFWYEYSLSLAAVTYGFDFGERKVTFYDDGNTRLNTSTWELCGKAVASVLQLPIQSDSGPSLSDYKNDMLYISSFGVSQRDIFESVKRVTGTTDKDWTIEHEDIKERYQGAVADMISGQYGRIAFAKALYARPFYPDEPGFFEKRGELANQVLGLPKEDLDACTKRAVEKAQKDGQMKYEPVK